MIQTFSFAALLFLGSFSLPTLNPSQPVTLEEDGALLYKQYCKACHGKTAERDNKKIPSLVTSSLSNTEKVTVIQAGRNNMPAFGEILAESQIQAILDFVASIPSE